MAKIAFTSSGELRLFIAEAVRAALDDPDFGLELREETKKALQARVRSRNRLSPFSEIKRKYAR